MKKSDMKKENKSKSKKETKQERARQRKRWDGILEAYEHCLSEQRRYELIADLILGLIDDEACAYYFPEH